MSWRCLFQNPAPVNDCGSCLVFAGAEKPPRFFMFFSPDCFTQTHEKIHVYLIP